jgi:DUF971 family protein
MLIPKDIQLVGEEVAILWSDGSEDYLSMERLRAASPSAENLGEADLFGNVRGGDPRKSFPGVRVDDWDRVGNYAIRFTFNDGHNTGLYTYRYLKVLAERVRAEAESGGS